MYINAGGLSVVDQKAQIEQTAELFEKMGIQLIQNP